MKTDRENILKLSMALLKLVSVYENDFDEPVPNRPNWLIEAIKISDKEIHKKV